MNNKKQKIITFIVLLISVGSFLAVRLFPISNFEKHLGLYFCWYFASLIISLFSVAYLCSLFVQEKADETNL